ncbi:unnamed protein product [Rotaria magnacalcarata]|uniref:Hexosyltransferase n=4 Tax=Rotaria magnacalcarata TaxID=392030 RepID=A0A816MRS0_9BILA|nr:unnamed protein product [Rotaria magnacalcarata]CAF1677320.1 unnamed protein product [Rotaria magnacalcarata]CAF1986378.1 unnamed protein product [Rotaria magnacalcarata]
MLFQYYKLWLFIIVSLTVGWFPIRRVTKNSLTRKTFSTCVPLTNDMDSNMRFIPDKLSWMVKKSDMCYSISDLMNITNWNNIEIEKEHDGQSVHLISQWYQESNLRRRHELIAVLHMNVINNAVSKIHLLQPSEKPCTVERDVQVDPHFPVTMLKSKLVIRFLDNFSTERLTIKQAIEYANSNIENAYVVLINLDTFFDQSLSILASGPMTSHKTIFYISRYEIDPKSTKLGTQCSRKYMGSHDALIFQPPVASRIAHALPFEMGTWHIETKVIYEFVRRGYRVRNVCKTLRIWHLHSSQVRHRLMPDKRYVSQHQYRMVIRPPETL